MTKTHLQRILFITALIASLGFEWPFPGLVSHPNSERLGTNAWVEKEMHIIRTQVDNIDAKVLRLSLIAYMRAKKSGAATKPYLTVIDYSKPSYEKRLWVFDLQHGRTLFNTWVSHGKNSGDTVPRSFSNTPGSLKSSLGVFVTDNAPYEGGHGYSLRLRGLEHGVNDNAYNRDIVIHGAWYVNADTIRRYGAVGRSWGCPAVSDSMVKPLINTIKERSVVFAYYPDRQWLSHSRYLA